MPDSSAEIPDEQSARVVVLGLQHSHKSNDRASAAMREIERIMNSRGNAPRHHRNMLVFIAPDSARAPEWQDSIRKYLAWGSILEDRQALNLDAQQQNQVEEAIKRESQTVDERLQQTYCWLIAPRQPDPQGKISYDAERIRISDNFLQGAARKLKSNEWLIHALSPDNLLMELAPLNVWESQPHLRVKTLWDWLTKYCYLPRLYDRGVLEATIKDGVSRLMPAFAYATGVDDAGKYTGLTMGRQFTLYVDDQALIVMPAAAQAQVDAERAAQAVDTATLTTGGGRSATDAAIAIVEDDTPPPPQAKTRFYASKRIDAADAKRDLNQIADEVLRQLAALPGATSNISIDISGYCADGFDDATVRTLSENSRVLGLDDFGFETK